MTRLAFLGTPPVAAAALEALLDAGEDVVLVVSRADRRRSRAADPEPSAVKAAALRRGIPVSERVADVVDVGAELGVVVAFGRLIRLEVLDRVPMLNVHFSLLPRWRGAAPVERAILAGDPTTGVSVMRLEEGLDTGPLYASEEVPILPGETAGELRARLGGIGVGLLLDVLGRWPDRLGGPEPQRGEPTYAEKLSKDELALDWGRRAVELERVVRVGRAWTTFRSRRLLVHRARIAAWAEPFEPGSPGDGSPSPGALRGDVIWTGDTAASGLGLELLEVQAEGRARQSFVEWARCARPGVSERLGS